MAVQLEQRVLPLLEEARRSLHEKNFPKVKELSQQVLSIPGIDLQYCHAAIDNLTAINEFELALEACLKLIEDGRIDVTLLSLCGYVAVCINKWEISIKLFKMLTQIDPENPSHHVNLADAYKALNLIDDAIEHLQNAIALFPNYAPLWNLLGNIAAWHLKQRDDAITFFETAIELQPNYSDALMNLANLFADVPRGLDLYRAAIACDETNYQARINLAYSLMVQGDLREAWKHYAVRNEVKNSEASRMQMTHGIPCFQGDDFKNKTILVTSEQGIGDEILFAIAYRWLVEQGAKIIIGCEPRLKSIFKRSFPESIVEGFQDTFEGQKRLRSYPSIEKQLKTGELAVDGYLPCGSLLQYTWSDRDALYSVDAGYMLADLDLVEKFAQKASGGQMKVGISWRSGKQTAERNNAYYGLENAARLMKGIEADFYNLQYSSSQEELDELERLSGKKIIHYQDVNLKDDIEANLAIMKNMDLVMGPPTATQMLSLALGQVTWIISYGAPWYAFGHKVDYFDFMTKDTKLAIAPNCEILSRYSGPWQTTIDAIIAKFIREYSGC